VELLRCHGRGHRPCHSATLILGPPGAQSPRPAPAPPPAGASRPPGRALASVGVGGTGPGGSVPRGRGKRSAFPGPARSGGGIASLPWQGLSPLPQRPADLWPAGGPKPPASARPATGGRFSPAGSGAGLCYSRTCRSTENRRAGAAETQCVSCSRPDRRRPFRRCHGRGHRPCHSAALIPGQPGAQSPRPAPAPPSAGASRPPGRALASAIPGPAGLRGTVPHGRGKRMRFLFPPGLGAELPR
jgi:hypothetical protein